MPPAAAAEAATLVSAKTEEDGTATPPPVPRTTALGNAKAEEEVDFGGAEEDATAVTRGAPRRALPDYGDIIDADPDEQKPRIKKAEVKMDPLKCEPRPDTIHISGCQRLTRTHLAEIFEAKGLPMFTMIEWIDDERLLCVFASATDAATALRGAEEGFGNTMAEAKSLPGPGLWRAQRDMMDFREATAGDEPEMGFTKKHRGGKQVREFRFWEAIKDVDNKILDEETRGHKRAPDGVLQGGAKRAKVERKVEGASRGGGDASDSDGADLLDLMAKQDKNMFAKQEDEDTDNVRHRARGWFDDEDRGRDSWRGGGGRGDDWNDWGSWKGSGKGGGRRLPDDAWQHDNRGRDSWQRDDDSWRGKGGGSRGGGKSGKKRTSDAAPLKPMDDAEKARRAKRNERFNL